MRIAYQGEPGAFSEEAALLDCGPGALLIPKRSFTDVVAAVMNGTVDRGVLPVENSIIGIVQAGATAAATPGLAILRKVEVPVRQCLLVKRGTALHTITRVLSHPAALGQCSGFLAAHPHIAPVEWYDTAGAAKHVAAESESTTAAIASRRAAEQYGLQVAADEIQDQWDNFTRFVVVSCRVGC